MNRGDSCKLLGVPARDTDVLLQSNPSAVGDSSGRPTSSIPGKDRVDLADRRPPQLETRSTIFDRPTPNEAFLRRGGTRRNPDFRNLRTFRLNVSGYVPAPLQLSVDTFIAVQPLS